jgi:cytochrome c oxidase accessory protein FixG
MEMVFRKIEYWIEGDANEQRRLNKEAWSPTKLGKKGLKHLIYVLISVLIAHTVMSYLIGVEQVLATVQQSPAENWAGFTGLVAFTGIFYYVFAFFREQVCVAVCPYGRLQGVLLNKDSIMVAYDHVRGEPRGKLKKGVTATDKGDCIDCRLCVHVCPTGIDIRNGTQLECVNCTACIDACDDVMLKIGKPKGLIRFASINSIQNGIKKLFTSRVRGYSVVLIALVTLLSFMIATRSEVETTMLKVPGTLYQKKDNGNITNLYNVEFVNKTFDEMPIELRVESPSTATLVRPDSAGLLVPAGGFVKVVYFLEIPGDELSTTSTAVRIGVYSKERLLEKISVKFIGPIQRKSK